MSFYRNITESYYARRGIFVILAFVAVSFLLTYSYFINKAVRNTVMRQKTAVELNSISSSVAELESRFIALKRTVTTEKAEELGFKEVTDLEFISKKSFGHALSLNNEI
ncbi:MAG: hypothetical protein A2836_01460 [Candidatus Taylorbacteria bacterium RIFCSPHIGHO2_01_FULL_45_63]|uniref:Cell division protein FtsL n=1 Tax=Candidatus Taylorbacteria bacterium RIFCSPHIGHO2_02_FULL_45_35 TaxID=1802311 RepID=A0A1G2MXZ8_9BACT|nr:MAG: hypothetical protein A2836_01460 [Candidatus Taylorbacteria bacterium RIFCSPHIGHO2_01_FULL_45_63]OHA28079.1 MAG: hypothetical protein A3D56_00165 [Candidatus Taylorbacteria bacterium RIFCSPHIGHO2_02_FULL_45_35]OHA34904.1 MAG: hypothetical protein A3A22_02960 [Candidatus Taylorbacteria bacterium RIFCSPLOWO2_01_FULL_45_34b]